MILWIAVGMVVPVALAAAVATWLVRRKRAPAPRAVYEPRAWVRILEDAELSDAVERAVRTEGEAARQVANRIARYEAMGRQGQVVQLPAKRDLAESA